MWILDLPPLVESQTVVLPDGENHFNSENQPAPRIETDPQVEIDVDNGSHHENAEKKSETSNLRACDKKNHSDGEATSAGDGGAVFSSEDSENDDNEFGLLFAFLKL